MNTEQYNWKFLYALEGHQRWASVLESIESDTIYFKSNLQNKICIVTIKRRKHICLI